MLAGGGSGFVTKDSVTVPAGSVLRIDSSQQGNKFTFSVSSVTAENKSWLVNSTAGQDGVGYEDKEKEMKGGDGYSGGGFGRNNTGGRDGSDGECDGQEDDMCGAGSNILITELSTRHFNLSPGDAGRGAYRGGGGGGGVLVNQRGPARLAGTSYGAASGGEDRVNDNIGCVLIDIKQRDIREVVTTTTTITTPTSPTTATTATTTHDTTIYSSSSIKSSTVSHPSSLSSTTESINTTDSI